MMKFLHVGFGFERRPVARTKIEKVFGDAGWARYAPNCWIVHTDVDPDNLAEQLRAICGKDDSIFVCELKIGNHSGYLQKEIWDWIKRQMSKR